MAKRVDLRAASRKNTQSLWCKKPKPGCHWTSPGSWCR